MTMFHTRDNELHDFAADDAYRSYLISRNRQPIVYHSGNVRWKRLYVAARLASNHVKRFFAAIRVALVADRMRRAHRELARVKVRADRKPGV